MRPKSILLITTADTDILTAERALPGLPDGAPPVVAVNPTSLPPDDGGEIMALAADAGAVALRLLGGKRAMPAAFDALARHCRNSGIPLIACPGHQEWDEDLVAACTVAVAEVETVFAYLMQGGVPNFQNLFLFLSDTYFGTDYGHEAPAPLPWEGIYHPDLPDGMDVDAYIAARFRPGRPSIGLLFYRAHWMSGNLLPIDALIRSLESHGANVLPVFAFSLKHSPESAAPGGNRAFTQYLAGPDGQPRVHCIINTMGMSMGQISAEGPSIAAGWSVDYLDNLNVPVIQAIAGTGPQSQWLESDLGLGPIDTAMSIALPEFDGRIISVPVSFKEESEAGGLAGRLQRYAPRPDRVDLAARLAIKQARLALKDNADKKIALILSNYPTKDARIGNAVGLDTPASAIAVLHALRDAGYQVTDIPADGDELVRRIIDRCSNDRDSLTEQQLRLAAGHVDSPRYAQWFSAFPDAVAAEMSRHWGAAARRGLSHQRPSGHRRARLGPCVRGIAAAAGFRRKPHRHLPQPRLAPNAPLYRLLPLGSGCFRRRRHRSLGQARHFGMAAGQGHRPFPILLPRSGPGRCAAVLPVHHQRPRRGFPSQAPRPRRRSRPLDTGNDHRRQLRRHRPPRAVDGRTLSIPNPRSRQAAHTGSPNLGTGAASRTPPRFGHRFPPRRFRRIYPFHRRLSLRTERRPNQGRACTSWGIRPPGSS